MLRDKVVRPITTTRSAASSRRTRSSDKTIGACAIAFSKTNGSSATIGAPSESARSSISSAENPARSCPTITTFLAVSMEISPATTSPCTMGVGWIPDNQSLESSGSNGSSNCRLICTGPCPLKNFVRSSGAAVSRLWRTNSPKIAC